MAQSERRVFHTLDLLRGIAAIAVVLGHARSIATPFQATGIHLAVDLFFVMSGFVIAFVYDDRFRRGLSVRHFIAHRLIRLYPLYILGTIIALGAIIIALQLAPGRMEWNSRALLTAFPFAALMLPSVPVLAGSDFLYPLNLVAWSLLFEVIINVAYALTWRRLTVPVLLTVMGLAAVAIAAFAMREGEIAFGSRWSDAFGGLARVCFSFPCGILIAHLVRDGRLRLSVPVWCPIVAALAIFWVPITGPARLAFELACVLVILPLLTCAAVGAEPSPAFRGAFGLLGRLSYGVYVLHYPLLAIARSGIEKVGKMDPAHLAPWAGLGFVVVLHLACWVADRVYDVPVRRRLNAALGRS